MKTYTFLVTKKQKPVTIQASNVFIAKEICRKKYHTENVKFIKMGG